MKTMSLEKAPRTSALGHSSRYSEKRLGYANKTLCANQKRTFLLCLSRMHRASYLQEQPGNGDSQRDSRDGRSLKGRLVVLTSHWQGPAPLFWCENLC